MSNLSNTKIDVLHNNVMNNAEYLANPLAYSSAGMKFDENLNIENLTKEKILEILDLVKDPEIPLMSVIDMGIIRDIIFEKNKDEQSSYILVNVVITPTYSGCPAMKVIENDVLLKLQSLGIQAKVTIQLSPAWTTDWMSAEAKEKLRQSRIAPPIGSGLSNSDDMFKIIELPKQVPCPYCDSKNTKIVSEFGSTACKAFYTCLDCSTAFDYFKCH